MPPRPAPTERHAYWHASRAPRYSLLFALPLLAVYELLGVALARSGGPPVRNGAEALLTRLFTLFAGAWGGLALVGVVVIGCVALAARDLRRAGGGLRGRVFATMLGESAALAVVCAVVVGTITARLLHLVGASTLMLAPSPAEASFGPATRLMLSLGAGLFEELVFRVLLVGALAYGLRRFGRWRPVAAGAVAVVVGALVFSAAHYVGPLGDALTLSSFVFRAVAGLFFSLLFVLRGFGITAWTHALYDVLVLVV